MTPSQAIAATRKLFMSLFSASQLRSFVRYLPDGQALSNELPVGSVSLAELSDSLLETLEKHGRLDDELFDALVDERPRQASQIRTVRDHLRAAGLLSGGRPASISANTPPIAGPWDVFLAHASADKPRVRRYHDELLRLGKASKRELRVFLDEVSLTPGDIWTEKIPKALEASKVVVVFVSTATDRAWFEGDEIQMAISRTRARKLRIVPVYLDGFVETAPYGLAQLHGLDAQQRDVPAISEAILRAVDLALTEAP